MTESLARKWALDVRRNENISPGCMNSDMLAAADVVLANTKPQTMADVEWDDEKHRGLGAVDDAGQEWVMLQDDGGYINCVGLDLNPVGAERDELTPNGKRYRLVEMPVNADGEPKWFSSAVRVAWGMVYVDITKHPLTASEARGLSDDLVEAAEHLERKR